MQPTTRPYKAVAGFVLTAAGLIVQALVSKGDTAVTAREWVVILVGSVVTSGAVWGITNPPSTGRRDDRGASDLVTVLAVVGLVLVILFCIFGWPGRANATPVQPARPYWIDRACPAEDSNNCVWDAEQRGDARDHDYCAR